MVQLDLNLTFAHMLHTCPREICNRTCGKLMSAQPMNPRDRPYTCEVCLGEVYFYS